MSDSKIVRLVDIEAVALYLGVGVRHVRRLVAERRIPFVKWGRLLRFDLDVVDRWIADHCVDLDRPSKTGHLRGSR